MADVPLRLVQLIRVPSLYIHIYFTIIMFGLYLMDKIHAHSYKYTCFTTMSVSPAKTQEQILAIVSVVVAEFNKATFYLRYRAAELLVANQF